MQKRNGKRSTTMSCLFRNMSNMGLRSSLNNNSVILLNECWCSQIFYSLKLFIRPFRISKNENQAIEDLNISLDIVHWTMIEGRIEHFKYILRQLSYKYIKILLQNLERMNFFNIKSIITFICMTTFFWEYCMRIMCFITVILFRKKLVPIPY